jgi:hypothetical protein
MPKRRAKGGVMDPALVTGSGGLIGRRVAEP